MWKIEITYKYNGVISHLVYASKEEADRERNLLLPLLGKDHYDLQKNEEIKVVTLADKHGTLDVVVTDVKSVRCYDGTAWDDEIMPRTLEYERKIAQARKID